MQVTRVHLGASDDTLTLRGAMVLDATELSDLLPLAESITYLAPKVSATLARRAYRVLLTQSGCKLTLSFCGGVLSGENHVPNPQATVLPRHATTFNLYYVHQGCKRLMFPTEEVLRLSGTIGA